MYHLRQNCLPHPPLLVAVVLGVEVVKRRLLLVQRIHPRSERSKFLNCGDLSFSSVEPL